MLHISVAKIGKFTWQMAYANGEFDVDNFLKKECMIQMQRLKTEYMKFIDDPMNSKIIEYWKEVGVKKDYYPGNLLEGVLRRDSNYYSVLGPIELEKGRKYPVVYFCHGGGDESFDAETYGVAEWIQETPFFYVCPNFWGAGEFERILDEMEANGYPIDESKVYAMGFSGGSASASEIAIQSPMRVTGVALIPGANAINQCHLQEVPTIFDEYKKLQVPTIFIGGACDGGDSWPLVDEYSFRNYNHWMDRVVGVPDFEKITKEMSDKVIRQSNNFVEREFGLTFHKSYINEWQGEYIYVGDFFMRDGACIARFASVKGYPHGVYPIFFGIAWEFLKDFSKDIQTGEIHCTVPEIDFRTRRAITK